MGFSFLSAISGRSAPARSAKKSKNRSRFPAGAPETPLTEALATRPRPLVDVRKKLIVIFSPKAACTNVVIWFLNHLGHLPAAQDYARFPHPYRVQVYYRSNIYRKAFSTDLSRFSTIRIIRDPFERVVSGFRHVQRLASSDALIAETLGIANIDSRGLSFREFLNFLERCDMHTCDRHYGFQRHPIETHLPVKHLINVSTQDLYLRLNEIEKELRLPPTVFEQLAWIKALDHQRFGPRDVIAAEDVYDRRFNHEEARSGAWPAYRSFLTDEAKARIARLYSVDLEAYGIEAK